MIEWITEEQVNALFPKRKSDSHKGVFGHLLCITGSRRMPGAAIMSAQAGLRCGVGLMTVATAQENVPIMAANCWEAMYLPLHTDAEGFLTWQENETVLSTAMNRATAILIGCGLGVTAGTIELTRQVITEAKCPVIVDADGLNVLASCIDIVQKNTGGLILTPHPGEMARLLQTNTAQIQQDRAAAAQAFCRRYPSVVLALKGHETLVCQDDRIQCNPTGNAGMSRGGSGDVLAGMLGGIIAQGKPLFEAVCAGVYLHGKAGDYAAEQLGEIAMLPRDTIAAIAGIMPRG